MGGADDGLQHAEGPIDSKVTCVKRFTLLCDIGANGQRMVAFSLRRDCWSVPFLGENGWRYKLILGH
jgi:hypothetical protein